MADDMKPQQSLLENSVPDIPKTEIEAGDMKLQQSLQGSGVSDVPKTEVKIETLVSMDNLTLATMSDDMKLQQSLQESSALDIPKTEVEDYFPAPLVSPERPDLEQEPSSPGSPEHPLWRVQRWKDILSKEERNQQCPRCKEIGHGLNHCPYPVCMMVAEKGKLEPMVCNPKGKYRCSRCGRRGHNRRTCHGPVSY